MAMASNSVMLNVAALLTPSQFDHPVTRIELIETHISWVILTGEFVYKIKKPVNFGFLDFTTLAKRKHFCEEELRLNRRLAPHIYLTVVPITGTVAHPSLGGEGEAIDYALRMRQFPQEAQLDRMLARDELKTEYIDAIAECIASFHQHLEPASATSDFGDPDHVWHPVDENFVQIREHDTTASHLQLLAEIERWSRASYNGLRATFTQRKQDGFIRECHGDLHLRNIAWYQNQPIIFDCIEFNPDLRWIDVISDIAFLIMDLIDRGQSPLAYRLLNLYLSHTGDYPAIRLLPFYLVYRAMVRAKVDMLRLSQVGLSREEQHADEAEFLGYLELARGFIHRAKPVLMITWGLSASGKTTMSGSLLEVLAAIRIRSDVERKRLVGMKPVTSAAAAVGSGIYSAEMTERTYTHLLNLAREILAAGFPVIVDAAFLDAQRRQQFAQLAEEMQVPFIILQCVARADILRQRIIRRQPDASDADLGVLEHQLAQHQPLSHTEQGSTVTINTEQALDVNSLVQQINTFLAKVH